MSADGTASAAAAASSGEQAGDSIRNVPILLRTSIPGAAIPLTPYLVPASWRRVHLSTLVNRVLRTQQQQQQQQDGSSLGAAGAAQQIPFDFIVDGQLLRNVTLGEYIEREGKDAEVALELEYVRSIIPPRFENQIPQDDWVSAVDASRKGLFLTSSYDGTIRIFSHSSTAKPLYSIKASPSGSSNASLTSTAWIPSSTGGDDLRIATSGMDGCVRLFDLPSDALDLQSGAAARAAQQVWCGSIALHASASSSSYAAHASASSAAPGTRSTHPLSSVSASADGQHLLTAGWDGLVAYWSTEASSSGSAGAVDEFDTTTFRPVDLEEEVDADDGADLAEIEEDEDQEDGGRKRRKVKNGSAAATAASSSAAAASKRARAQAHAAMGPTHAPELVLRHVAPSTTTSLANGAPSLAPGSNAKVAGAIFDVAGSSGGGGAGERIYSAGWDGSVKAWDIASGGLMVVSKASDKAICAVTQLRAPTKLLATANIDRSLGLWDLSTSNTGSTSSSVVLSIPEAHSAPVTGVAAHRASPHIFASTSLDGSVKGWDVRSTKQALFALAAPPAPASATSNGRRAVTGKERLLCLDWTDDGQGIVAGGEDCRLSIWRGQGIGQEELVSSASVA